MKNIEEFTEVLSKGVLDVLPKELSASLKLEPSVVVKANDQELHGITFMKSETEANPVFYIDEMHECYLKGKSLDLLIHELCELYIMSLRGCPAPDPMVLDYDSVKDHLAFRLIDKRKNKNYLATVPHIDMGFDLAMTLDIRMDDGRGGMWRTPVLNNMFEEIEDQDMIEKAYMNARTTDPPFMIALCNGSPDDGEALNLLDGSGRLRESEKGQFYVLTNIINISGASALFYPGVQRDIASRLGESYFAVPSSVNEFLIIPESSGMDHDYLKGLLDESNRIIVKQNEILTDRIFYYDIKTGSLEPCEDGPKTAVFS